MNRKITGFFESREVFINGSRLAERASQQVVNHSPDGFCWGYGGSGPAQLSLALLLYFFDREFALKYYQRFKWEVVAKLAQSDFVLYEHDILKWAAALCNPTVASA